MKLKLIDVRAGQESQGIIVSRNNEMLEDPVDQRTVRENSFVIKIRFRINIRSLIRDRKHRKLYQ